jgi:hypothetical protein
MTDILNLALPYFGLIFISVVDPDRPAGVPATPGNASVVAMPSFDQFVGATEEVERNREAKSLCRLQVDDHFDLRNPLDRQVARLLAPENSTGISSTNTVGFRKAAAIADQPTGRGEGAKLKDRGHGHTGR